MGDEGARATREVIIAHAPKIQPVTHVRSTLLQSSIATLKAGGHYERYSSLLSPAHRDRLFEHLAPGWVPIELALAHYQACNDLQLGEEEIIGLGSAAADRFQGGFMETLTRAARNMGVTPWLLLKRFDSLWGRLMMGGSIELTKVGPKDLTIEVVGASLPRVPYFRTAFCGVVRAGYKYVGVRMAYVRTAKWDPTRDTFVMRAAWA